MRPRNKTAVIEDEVPEEEEEPQGEDVDADEDEDVEPEEGSVSTEAADALEDEEEEEEDDHEIEDDVPVPAPSSSRVPRRTSSRKSKRRRSLVMEDESAEELEDEEKGVEAVRKASLPSESLGGGEQEEEYYAEEVTAVPSRMTKRQRAVMERQTRQATGEWTALEVPDSLAQNWKGRGNPAASAEAMTEEQVLKRLEATNLRRAHQAKKRKEEEENVKARIRAATSAKFKAEADRKVAKEAAVQARRNRPLQPGFIRVKMQPDTTTMFWPGDDDPADFFPPQNHTGYPIGKCDVPLLGIQPAAHGLKAGSAFVALPTSNDTSRLLCMSESGDTYGFIKLDKGHSAKAGKKLTGHVRTIGYCKDGGENGEPEKIVIRLNLVAS